MKTRAAVAFAAKTPLEIIDLDLDGPRAGEALVEIIATGICHIDAYTLDGFDSIGLFASVLGHEGAGIVREVRAGSEKGDPTGVNQCLILGSTQTVPRHRVWVIGLPRRAYRARPTRGARA